VENEGAAAGVCAEEDGAGITMNIARS